MPTTTRKTEKADGKTTRRRFGGRRQKLQVEPIDGYRLRWINDQDGRIQDAIEGGYEFVEKSEIPEGVGDGQIHQDNSDLNSRVSKVVSRGEPIIRAFLMKIKEEYYLEDQAAKEEVNKATDEAMRMGSPSGNVVDNQYVPEGHQQKV